LVLAEEADVVAQLAQPRVQVVAQPAAVGPGEEAVEVPAVGQQRVVGQAALGADVVVERLDVVGQLGHGSLLGAEEGTSSYRDGNGADLRSLPGRWAPWYNAPLSPR